VTTARYRALRAEGRCARCAGQAVAGKAFCEPCRVIVVKNVRDLRARRRAAGECENCQATTEGKHVLCEDCRADRREYWPKYAETRRERRRIARAA
jgi:hypothetical protein